jgi:polysaccharide deacetylase family protein (PEP-CTERM system associated)
VQNALTIDVEEHFQVHNLESAVSRSDWDGHESRVEANVERILELLDRRRTKATFFVLGWVAERHPELVGHIASLGHEVASHGYAHRLVYSQTQQEFADDLERSTAILRDALSRATTPPRWPLRGYRAPSFSITAAAPWALDTIRDAGFCYDSSIMPASGHDRYGMKDVSRFAHASSNGLIECPVSTVRCLGRNWPAAGGGYFRLFPIWFTRWAVRRINSEGHPAVVYLHPWEFDPMQPRIHGPSAWMRFRHYVNLDKTYQRLDDLLGRFTFGPMCEVYADLISGAGESALPRK